MIHEYAFDPTVLLSWASNSRDYAEFLREYGLGTPRIASSFPKRSAAKLRSYLLKQSPADEQSLHARRYTEIVAKMVEVIILRELPQYQTSDWIELAMAENRRVPFGALISSEPLGTVECVTPSNMHEKGSAWNHPNQKNICRTLQDMFDAISGLLRLSSQKIVFVDPYGWTPESIEFIRFAISNMSVNRVSPDFPAIELFYKEKRGGPNSGQGSPAASYVKTQIAQGLGGAAGIDVHVFALSEIAGNDVFHNRCILTEHGGLITGHGFGVTGIAAHTDEVVLMRPEVYQKKWDQFSRVGLFNVVSQA